MGNDDFATRVKNDIFDEAMREIGEILAVVEGNFELVQPEFRFEFERMVRAEFKHAILGALRKFKHDQLLRRHNLKNSSIN